MLFKLTFRFHRDAPPATAIRRTKLTCAKRRRRRQAGRNASAVGNSFNAKNGVAIKAFTTKLKHFSSVIYGILLFSSFAWTASCTRSMCVHVQSPVCAVRACSISTMMAGPSVIRLFYSRSARYWVSALRYSGNTSINDRSSLPTENIPTFVLGHLLDACGWVSAVRVMCFQFFLIRMFFAVNSSPIQTIAFLVLRTSTTNIIAAGCAADHEQWALGKLVCS